MDQEQEFTYTMYCGDGGDGGGDGGGSGGTDTGDMGSEAANEAATNAANDSVGGSDNDGGYGGFDGTESANDEGFGSTETGFDGTESYNDAASASASAGGSSSEGSSGGGNATDTGDLGSEAANVAATQSGAASVGVGSGVTDTGDLGSEAANVAATVSGAASVGLDSTSFTNPYSKTGMVAKNISNYMKGNIGETALASALTAITGIPGLAALNAYFSVYGSPISSTVSGVSSDDAGGGDTGTAITSVAPYLIGNTQAQPSQVLQYFSNLQNQPQTDGLLSRYDQAKQNISGILGTNNQLGVSNTSNFYYNYLNQKGLL